MNRPSKFFSSTSEGIGRISLAVARTYKVSEKTVRDIWRGRTWHHETLHLDPPRAARADAPRSEGQVGLPPSLAR